MNKRWSLASGALILAFGLAACKGPQAKVLASPYRAPAKVAVLPVANQSVDIEAPELLRGLFRDAMARRGYTLLPLEQIDSALHDMSINEAGQLGSVTPQQVAEKLGADGLVYGTVLDFAFQNLGYYQNKKVSANFRLLDASGTVLWEGEESASKKFFTADKEEAKRAFAVGLAEQAVRKGTSGTKLGKALGIRKDLEEQARLAVAKIASTLPPRN